MLPQLKSMLMAGYFAFDHIIWSGQAGLVADTKPLAKYQRISSFCWFGGSLCTITCEAYEIMRLLAIVKGEESEEDWEKEKNRIDEEVHRRSIILIHACLQVNFCQWFCYLQEPHNTKKLDLQEIHILVKKEAGALTECRTFICVGLSCNRVASVASPDNTNSWCNWSHDIGAQLLYDVSHSPTAFENN